MLAHRTLEQGLGICDPRSKCGPPDRLIWPGIIFVTQFRIQNRVKTKLHDKQVLKIVCHKKTLPRSKIKVEFYKINCYLRPASDNPQFMRLRPASDNPQFMRLQPASDNPQFMPPLTVNRFPTPVLECANLG